MTTQTKMRLITIILCLALVLGLIIIFSASSFLNSSKIEHIPPEKSLSISKEATPNLKQNPKEENDRSEPLVTPEPIQQSQPVAKEPNAELKTQAKITKAISKHSTQTAENDLLRYQAKKLEHEIQQKLQNLEQKKQ